MPDVLTIIMLMIALPEAIVAVCYLYDRWRGRER
jgi:hypothetical protein